jgi:protein TonB
MKTILFLIFIFKCLDIIGQQTDSTSLQNNVTIYEYYQCDEKAAFPGGDRELLKYISEHIIYPQTEIECPIEGTVYIKFVVTKTGEIGGVIVKRSVDKMMDDDAVKVVKSLPKWEPAKIKGEPVNSWFIVPVKFKLY